MKDKEGGLKTLGKHRFPRSNAIILWGKQKNNNNQALFRLKIYILSKNASFCRKKCFCILGLSGGFKIKIYMG